MSSDFTYTPNYVPCPYCGYMIPYADISSTSMYECPGCHRQIPAGVVTLTNSSTEEG